MKIRYFFSFALLFLVLVGAYTFYISTDYYTLQNTLLVEFSITLPVALWICLPAVCLFVLALLFMGFASLVQKFKSMTLHRDIEKLFTQIQEQMLGNPVRERVFSNTELKTLSKTLQRFILLPDTKSHNTNYEKIDSIFNSFKEIEDGKNDPKIRLNPSHPLYNLNAKNAIKDDSQKAFDTLKQDFNKDFMGQNLYTQNSTQAIYDKAWEVLLNGQQKVLQKALNLDKNHLTYTTLLGLVKTCAKGNISIQKDMVIQTCKKVSMNEREYLGLAIAICELLRQDNINFWLSVFETLSKEVEQSVLAYFYILLEVGKTSEAMDLKQQYPKDDFLPVSAFSTLKEKGYPLLVFFDPLLYRARKQEKVSTENVAMKQIDYVNH